jgi:ribosomal protein S18 acetylase RimI-like enzyme
MEPGVYQLTAPLSPDSEIVAELVRAWRDARAERLQFLTDLHSADEDRAYLCGTVLPGNEVHVAKIGQQVAGFIAFGHGWVNQLYVAPPFQGRGIGTQLLTIAMRRHPILQLWVFEVNLPAIHFYERRGFRMVERTDGATNEAKRPDLRMQWDAANDGACEGR